MCASLTHMILHMCVYLVPFFIVAKLKLLLYRPTLMFLTIAIWAVNVFFVVLFLFCLLTFVLHSCFFYYGFLWLFYWLHISTMLVIFVCDFFCFLGVLYIYITSLMVRLVYSPGQLGLEHFLFRFGSHSHRKEFRIHFGFRVEFWF